MILKKTYSQCAASSAVGVELGIEGVVDLSSFEIRSPGNDSSSVRQSETFEFVVRA